MAAIDSRATITCNLGDVISGGVSDSYPQNAGLVFTRGQIDAGWCENAGHRQ